MKIDKRKNYYMVFDTETTSYTKESGLGFPLIYDLAYAIVDKKGKIYEKENYIIKEVYYNKMFSNAFYGSKRPIYEKMIENKEVKVSSFPKAMYEINNTLKKYPNMTIAAYNLGFDIRALKNTAKITKVKWYDNKDVKSLFYSQKVKKQDIWSLAVETILSVQKGFPKFIEKHDLYTEVGNPLSNAEVAYQYIHKDPNFIEDHTALSDVLIEVEIMAHSFRQNKKFTKGIRYSPYHLLTKHKKEKVA